MPVGYAIAQDQYAGRNDVGIIYQLNVLPLRQRNLIGGSLINAMFDRAAYGCRLFCCWCAQDIEANRFWESLGFVPLAFRAGSREKGRVHIFWQRRIRAGDTSTPYWFPSQTTGGSIREDRLVLPIPPGTHWRDVMPVVLPAEVLPTPPVRERSLSDQTGRPRQAPHPPTPTAKRRVQFGPPSQQPQQPVVEKPKPAKKQPRAKLKNDPRQVAAARELRDRWLEQVNAAGGRRHWFRRASMTWAARWRRRERRRRRSKSSVQLPSCPRRSRRSGLTVGCCS